jgi:hypothetical protein
MENIKFILCSNANSNTPCCFWSWKILTEEKLKNINEKTRKNKFYPYQGSPSLIPHDFMKKIEIFEKHIGRSIIRPIMHGNIQTVTTG